MYLQDDIGHLMQLHRNVNKEQGGVFLSLVSASRKFVVVVASLVSPEVEKRFTPEASCRGSHSQSTVSL